MSNEKNKQYPISDRGPQLQWLTDNTQKHIDETNATIKHEEKLLKDTPRNIAILTIAGLIIHSEFIQNTVSNVLHNIALKPEIADGFSEFVDGLDNPVVLGALALGVVFQIGSHIHLSKNRTQPSQSSL